MDARSSQIAQALRAAGVGAGDRVARIEKNGPDYFELLFGAAKLNAVLVDVNWRLAPPEMAQIVNDAQAKVLFVGSEFVAHLDKIESDLATVSTIVVIGDGWSAHPALDGWVAGQPATDPGVEAAPDDVCLQLYTSGTTASHGGRERAHGPPGGGRRGRDRRPRRQVG